MESGVEGLGRALAGSVPLVPGEVWRGVTDADGEQCTCAVGFVDGKYSPVFWWNGRWRKPAPDFGYQIMAAWALDPKARSIAEAASGGKGPRPEPRREEGGPEVSTGTKRMLTPAQLKALRTADTRGWHPYGGPEHRVARRLTELGLYSSGTGKPTDRGRAYLARLS